MARKARLRTLPRDYNYHAVIHGDLPAADRRSDFADMTTMHYHKLLSKSSWRDPTRRVRDFDPRGERYEWLRQQMRELGIGRPGGLRGLAARLVRKLRKLSGAAAPG